MPFLSEAIYRNLAARDETDTVHLAEWPVVEEAWRDEELVKEMRLMQRLISLGLAAPHECRSRWPPTTDRCAPTAAG